jgi:hypothetical protein
VFHAKKKPAAHFTHLFFATETPDPKKAKRAKISLPHLRTNYWQQLHFDAKI